jgi:putative spermidine/putrescine transport system substrate-binding protein
MRRRILFAVLFLLIAAGATFWWWSRPLPILTVTSWAGVYGRAQAASQMQPYGVANRVNVRIAQWADNGTLAELQKAMTSGQVGDVIDLELPVAEAACAQGLLEPIDAPTLPPGADGRPAGLDFHKGMVGKCFVASAVYGQAVACRQPCGSFSINGLFFALAQPCPVPADDSSIVCGRIGLQRGAKVNLELALLADGVPAEQVYALLGTEAGAARAFAKLDTIKPNIVWWSNPSEPATLLRSRQVKIATLLTGEAQAAFAAGDVTLNQMQFYEADVLAIPRGAAKKDMALDYIRYATGSAPLAGMARFAPYLPPRRSSMPLVEKLPASPTRDFVVSQKGVLDTSFAIDDAWWLAHGAALEARFRSWVAG